MDRSNTTRKNRPKIWLIPGALALLLFAIAACGGGGDAATLGPATTIPAATAGGDAATPGPATAVPAATAGVDGATPVPTTAVPAATAGVDGGSGLHSGGYGSGLLTEGRA